MRTWKSIEEEGVWNLAESPVPGCCRTSLDVPGAYPLREMLRQRLRDPLRALRSTGVSETDH